MNWEAALASPWAEGGCEGRVDWEEELGPEEGSGGGGASYNTGPCQSPQRHQDPQFSTQRQLAQTGLKTTKSQGPPRQESGVSGV